eukprot:Gb_33167 [translate_table: standard]
MGNEIFNSIEDLGRRILSKQNRLRRFDTQAFELNEIRAWLALLLVESDGNMDVDNMVSRNMDVFGIEVDFCDAANSDNEVLWLLDMLDWK